MRKNDFQEELEQLKAETLQELKSVHELYTPKASATQEQENLPYPIFTPVGEKTEKAKKQPKHPHHGHRERAKKSADADPDFTTFSEIEVLEYLLYNTIPRIDTNKIAHQLIDAFGTFSGVLNANINELKSFGYINEQTARMLHSILPAARKAEQSRLRSNVVIDNIASAVAYLEPYYMNRNIEQVYLTCINNADRVISVDKIATGDTNFSSVEIKKIIETACRHKATKVLLSHNHPSGNLTPSQEDKRITARIVVALLSMNVVMIDHLIFSSKEYYSFFANRDFESIYTYADAIFNTNLVKELQLRTKRYKEGVYLTGDADIREDAPPIRYDSNIYLMSYALGHPKNPSLDIKERHIVKGEITETTKYTVPNL